MSGQHDAFAELADALHRAAQAANRLAGQEPTGTPSGPRPEPGLVWELKPADGETRKQYAARLDRMPTSPDVQAAKVAFIRDAYAAQWPQASQPFGPTVKEWLAALDWSAEDMLEKLDQAAAVDPEWPLSWLKKVMGRVQQERAQKGPQNAGLTSDMDTRPGAPSEPPQRVLGGTSGGGDGTLQEPSPEYLERQRKLKEALKRKGADLGWPEYQEPGQ